MKRVAGLLLLCCGLAAAQGRDFFPWWDMPIARDVSLTEDQTNRIQAIVREYRDRLVDLRAAVEKTENQMSDLINEDQPDTQKVNGALERSIQARSELTRVYSQMAFRIRLVLTPRQWKELQTRRPQGMPGGMRPGGGPIGPPMGPGTQPRFRGPRPANPGQPQPPPLDQDQPQQPEV